MGATSASLREAPARRRRDAAQRAALDATNNKGLNKGPRGPWLLPINLLTWITLSYSFLEAIFRARDSLS